MKRGTKEKVITLIDNHKGGLSSLLSSYDVSILEISTSIDQLKLVLENITDETIKKSILNKISLEESKRSELLRVKDEILAFLVKKQEQIKMLKERVALQEGLKQDVIVTLQVNIKKIEGEIEKQKKNFIVLEGFPDLQSKSKVIIDGLVSELNKIKGDLDMKKGDLDMEESNKTYSAQLFDDISQNNPELLSSNFEFLSKYTLKETKNSNGYKINKFFDKTTGEEINDISDLDIGVDTHTNYIVKKINDRYLSIQTIDGNNHGDFLLDNDTGVVLGKTVGTSFEDKGDNYIVIEDQEISSLGYHLLNLSTGKIINEEKFKNIPIGFNNINGNDVLVFRDSTCTKVFFESYPECESIGKKDGYIGEYVYKKGDSADELKRIIKYIISNLDESSYIFDKLKNMPGIVQIVSYNKILLLDNETLDPLGTITKDSVLFVSGDDIVLSLKDADGKGFCLYDITNKKELSQNIRSKRFSFDSIIVFDTKDNKSMIFDTKTKNMINVPKDVSVGSLVDGYLSISTTNNDGAIVDLKAGKVLHLKDRGVTIKNIITFANGQNQNNLLLVCEKDVEGEKDAKKLVYAYIDLTKRTDNGGLEVDKFYQNKSSKTGVIELSGGFFSKKLRIGENGKIIK